MKRMKSREEVNERRGQGASEKEKPREVREKEAERGSRASDGVASVTAPYYEGGNCS